MAQLAKDHDKEPMAGAATQEYFGRPPPKPSIFPPWLPPAVVSFCDGLEATGESMKDRLNIYTCDTCRGHVVTRDIDTGVTPFMTGCKATPDCKGTMRSSFYRVFDQSMRASHVWYRPAGPITDLLKPHVVEHLMNGGLLLREATEKDDA